MRKVSLGYDIDNRNIVKYHEPDAFVSKNEREQILRHCMISFTTLMNLRKQLLYCDKT